MLVLASKSFEPSQYNQMEFFSFKNRVLAYYLDCLYTTGLVYIMLFRYSVTSTSHLTTSVSLIQTRACLQDLTEFLSELNQTFDLTASATTQLNNSNLKTMFYVNRLQLLNVFTANLKLDEGDDRAKMSVKHLINVFSSHFSSQTKLELLKSSLIQKDNINMNEYLALHLKYLLVDSFYLVVPLIRSDPGLVRLYFNALFRMLLERGAGIGKEMLIVDGVNVEAMFNDKTLVKDLLVSFVGLLAEHADSSSETKGKKFLDMLEEFVLQDG